MSSATLSNDSCDQKYQVGEPEYNPNVYRCHLAIVKESDGSFSAIVLNLPGAGSCGASEEDAIANAREAVAGVVDSYRDDDESIPWKETVGNDVPEGAKQKWILVHV